MIEMFYWLSRYPWLRTVKDRPVSGRERSPLNGDKWGVSRQSAFLPEGSPSRAKLRLSPSLFQFTCIAGLMHFDATWNTEKSDGNVRDWVVSETQLAVRERD